MTRKRRKSLPRGNIRARGNEGGRRAREQRPLNASIPMENGRGGGGYTLRVSAGTSVTATKQQVGQRPGTGRKGIAWHLPPEGPPFPV